MLFQTRQQEHFLFHIYRKTMEGMDIFPAKAKNRSRWMKDCSAGLPENYPRIPDYRQPKGGL